MRKTLLDLYRRRGKTLRARWLERENRALETVDIDEVDQMIASVSRSLERLTMERLAHQTELPRKQLSA